MRRDEERIIGKKINEKRVMDLETDKTMLRVIEDRPAMQRSFGDFGARRKESSRGVATGVLEHVPPIPGDPRGHHV